MTQTAPLPPQNLDAEESVLGAMMLSPLAVEKAESEGLRPEDFYRESHGCMFRTALELSGAGNPVDAITLVEALRERKLLEKAGGQERVFEIANIVPSASNAGHYARIVRDAAAMRRLVRAGNNITRLGFEKPGDLTEVMAMAEAELTRAVASVGTAKAESIADGLDEMLAEIRHAYETGEAITGELTGFRTLDDQLGGFWPGQLVLLAARPSVGKSTLALNIAENFADRGVDAVHHARDVEVRASGAELGAGGRRRLEAAGVRPDERRPGEEARRRRPVVKGRDGTLLIQDSGDLTVSGVRAEARRLKRQKDLRLMVVDYLQLMNGTGQENRNQEVSAISRGLKLLARELEIPILALSQMSRAIEQRSEKRPQLSDLRESGSLEQDADVVLFLHQPADYDPDKEPDGTIEVIAAKARKGGTGTMTMSYNRSWSKLGDIGGGMIP
jgi:replicative DNA helicase